MKKDFKFPKPAPPPASSPDTSLSTNEQKAKEPEPNQIGTTSKGYEISPQEIPPPPPVEKEMTQGTQEEYGEDDVGPTVEVDLS